MAKLEAVLKPCNYCVHSSGTRAMHACHALWPCTVPICSYCAESTPPQEVEGARFPLPAHVLRNPEKGLSACADRATLLHKVCVLAAGRQRSLPHSLLHSARAARQHTRSAVLGAELVQGARDRLEVEGVEQEEAADVAALGVPQLGAAPAGGDCLGALHGAVLDVLRRHEHGRVRRQRPAHTAQASPHIPARATSRGGVPPHEPRGLHAVKGCCGVNGQGRRLEACRVAPPKAAHGLAQWRNGHDG